MARPQSLICTCRHCRAATKAFWIRSSWAGEKSYLGILGAVVLGNTVAGRSVESLVLFGTRVSKPILDWGGWFVLTATDQVAARGAARRHCLAERERMASIVSVV